MARKRLIKGANAARVEERIARVPADMARIEAPSIFGALRALEDVAHAPSGPQPERGSAARKPAARKARPARNAKLAPALAEAERPEPPAAPEALRPADKPATANERRPAKPGRLSPSDFNAAEREAIIRCCSDYRNHLPTYLLAVQKELRVLDSVIEKCKASKN